MDNQQPSPPQPDQTNEPGSQHPHNPTGYLKRFSPWLRGIAVLAIIAYILVSWDFSRTMILGFVQPSSYTSFPLGQNKQVTLNKTFYLRHQYCVDMEIELLMG